MLSGNHCPLAAFEAFSQAGQVLDNEMWIDVLMLNVRLYFRCFRWSLLMTLSGAVVLYLQFIGAPYIPYTAVARAI